MLGSKATVGMVLPLVFRQPQIAEGCGPSQHQSKPMILMTTNKNHPHIFVFSSVLALLPLAQT